MTEGVGLVEFAGGSAQGIAVYPPGWARRFTLRQVRDAVLWVLTAESAERRRVRRSGLFDAGWYREQYPEVPALRYVSA